LPLLTHTKRIITLILKVSPIFDKDYNLAVKTTVTKEEIKTEIMG